jgi:hypothetical protein
LKDNSGENLLDRLFRLIVHKVESSWLFKTVDPVGFIGRIATDAMNPLHFYTQGCIGNGWVVNELLHYIYQNPSEYVLILSELMQGRPVLLSSKTIHAATESETEPDDTLRPIHRRVIESILMKFYIPQYRNASPSDRMRAGGAGIGVEEALFGYKLITHLKGTPKSRLLALMKAHLMRYPFVTAMVQWKDKYHTVKIFRILDDRIIWINPWGSVIHSDDQAAVIHLDVEREMEQEAPSFEAVSLVEFFQRLIAVNIHAMVTLEESE